ncbi:MAG: nucleotide pyrophosphohydrolase [Caldilineaceae bacterium]|nr:nucleotide pyrophosphohydrolase [Caldilineaceae bacterium]MCB9137849.1 nucleotide pyrophosphohydrolase [Caldilineaceae bacterium]
MQEKRTRFYAEEDSQTTVGELRAAVDRFVDARDWTQYHTPKHLAMSIAIEAAEIMEHFQWYTAEESIARLNDTDEKAQVADELADVLIYCLSFANGADIDVSAAIRAKLARNETRFPINEVRGKLGHEI